MSDDYVNDLLEELDARDRAEYDDERFQKERRLAAVSRPQPKKVRGEPQKERVAS